MILSDYAYNLMRDTILPLFDGGYLRVYSGKKVVAECRLSDPAFAVGDPLRANAISPCLRTSSGRASTFSLFSRDNERLADGTVGLGDGADLVANDIDLEDGGTFSVKGLTMRVVR